MTEMIVGGRSCLPITGVQITASFAAFPRPLLSPKGQQVAQLTNEDIFIQLLGDDYEAKLATQGMDSGYPERVIGLKERRWTHWIGTPPDHQEENTVDLGVKAVQGLLQQMALGTDAIDMLLFSSTTPHKITSSSACAIGAALGLKAPSLDLKAGCTSGLYALLNAALHVRAGFGRVLLVASETLSKYANPLLPETVMGVGDGAVALLLEPASQKSGILGGYLGADGALGELVNTPGLLPPTIEAIKDEQYYYHGDPDALKEAVPARYIAAMEGALQTAGLTVEDLDLYIPHQVNRSLTQQVAQMLGIAEEKQFYNLHKHGSVGGAAVLIALHEALTEGHIRSGQKVALNVVGGGVTWGAIVWQF